MKNSARRTRQPLRAPPFCKQAGAKKQPFKPNKETAFFQQGEQGFATAQRHAPTP
jgi:hypothetical protein